MSSETPRKRSKSSPTTYSGSFEGEYIKVHDFGGGPGGQVAIAANDEMHSEVLIVAVDLSGPKRSLRASKEPCPRNLGTYCTSVGIKVHTGEMSKLASFANGVTDVDGQSDVDSIQTLQRAKTKLSVKATELQTIMEQCVGAPAKRHHDRSMPSRGEPSVSFVRRTASVALSARPTYGSPSMKTGL